MTGGGGGGHIACVVVVVVEVNADEMRVVLFNSGPAFP